MASIGSLGVAREAVDLDFEYFGETIRVHPDATDLGVADLMSSFGEMDIDDEEAAKEVMGGVAGFLRDNIHPEDRQKFWELAKANRQQLQDIILVAKAITEAVAEAASGFPTGQPSGSRPPTQSGSRKSRGGTSSQVRKARREAAAETSRRRAVTQEAMGLLDGRPDLKLALARQEAAAEAEEASA